MRPHPRFSSSSKFLAPILMSNQNPMSMVLNLTSRNSLDFSFVIALQQLPPRLPHPAPPPQKHPPQQYPSSSPRPQWNPLRHPLPQPVILPPRYQTSAGDAAASSPAARSTPQRRRPTRTSPS
uniref:Uncharacterized protein n=1 Tax=Zea mays TaxID=4577 RepID=C4IZC6_MAIZE|nr:unknown [Zea mays]